MDNRIDDNDDLILDLLAKDDSLASTLLYQRYYKPVFSYANAILSDTDATKDILQELFLAIWEKRHSLNLTKPLGKYLFTAAHNKAVNYKRDQKRRGLVLDRQLDRLGDYGAVPAADAYMEAAELAAVIRKAISLLPFKAKRVFLMSRKYGMTYSEIAKHLLVTDKAVEKNMSKALNLLRKFLGDYLKTLLIM